MKLLNIFKKGVRVIGSARSIRQVSIIRDDIENVSYLINYDLLAAYHVLPIEKQKRIDNFFNVHRPYEVMNLYMKWIEEYLTRTNENPFELNQKYKVLRISNPEFRNTLLSNIINS